MPRVLRSEMDAMCPRRDNSAATKYSPATPARSGGIFMARLNAANDASTTARFERREDSNDSAMADLEVA